MKEEIKKMIITSLAKILHQEELDLLTKQIIISKTKNTKFGDYSTNIALLLTKRLAKNPKEIANLIIKNTCLSDSIEKIELAGAGFINLFISQNFLKKNLIEFAKNDFSKFKTQKKETIVVDYSSPNIAKQMHVGHLRSTILGDSAVKILEFIGHKVIKANHIGDWGTQFGMLITYLLDLSLKLEDLDNLDLAQIEKYYQLSKQEFDNNENFNLKAKKNVVALQNGDKEISKIWQKLVFLTMQENQNIYDSLKISLTQKDAMGESVYKDSLKDLVFDLTKRKIATNSKGAVVIFLDKQNDECFLIQKQDGGFLYATTDIAAALHRVNKLKATRVLYFIDARQKQHMQGLFKVLKKLDEIDKKVQFSHLDFGMVLGNDKKPFKTREGKNIKLKDLINEANKRSEDILIKKNNVPKKDIEKSAQILAIAAIKYFELSKNRSSNYIFSFDKMLDFSGNTAPYLLYAYTRICAIFKKANFKKQNIKEISTKEIFLRSEIEINLAKHLLGFSQLIKDLEKNFMINNLCLYLYNLTNLFMNFYENCKILDTKTDDKTKKSRLIICLSIKNNLELGLKLLGIETLEIM